MDDDILSHLNRHVTRSCKSRGRWRPICLHYKPIILASFLQGRQPKYGSRQKDCQTKYNVTATPLSSYNTKSWYSKKLCRNSPVEEHDTSDELGDVFVDQLGLLLVGRVGRHVDNLHREPDSKDPNELPTIIAKIFRNSAN
jgi:hypothetical protein